MEKTLIIFFYHKKVNNVVRISYFCMKNQISMTMLNVKVINKGHQPLPAYATSQSAGMDLRANIDES